MSNAAIGMTGLLECEYFDLESRIVSDVFRIFVAKPAYLEDRSYPAIFVADGNSSFPMAMGIQRMLHWGAQAPAVIAHDANSLHPVCSPISGV
jgi:predicted alpha/beta superfamily hydrolase